jgi:hypothetical protein
VPFYIQFSLPQVRGMQFPNQILRLAQLAQHFREFLRVTNPVLILGKLMQFIGC